MLRIIAMLTLALLSACASNPTKTSRGVDESKLVQVTGTGATFDEAKMNGFNRAIEYVVGSVILTEKESKRDKLTRDDIINHSSGYVDNFKILNESRSGGKYQVTMDVYVKHSVIANRILNRDKETTVVDGERMRWQYQSYLDSRNTAMEVYRTVLSDYPVKAFSVKKTGSELMLDRNNSARLIVAYKLEWNYNFLKALNETLGLLADEKSRNIVQNKVLVNSKDPKNLFIGSRDVYYYNDDKLYNLIYEKLHKTTVVYATLLDVQGEVVQCRTSHSDMVLGGSYLWVQGVYNTESSVDFELNSMSAERLGTVFHVEFGITENTDYCTQYNKR